MGEISDLTGSSYGPFPRRPTGNSLSSPFRMHLPERGGRPLPAPMIRVNWPKTVCSEFSGFFRWPPTTTERRCAPAQTMVLRQRATNSLVAWERLHLFPQPHQAPESLSNGKWKRRQVFIRACKPLTCCRCGTILRYRRQRGRKRTQVVDFHPEFLYFGTAGPANRNG